MKPPVTFEQAFEDTYTWEYIPNPDEDYIYSKFKLVSHPREREIHVGRHNNVIQLYEILDRGGMGEKDRKGTYDGESAEEWVKERINYQTSKQR